MAWAEMSSGVILAWQQSVVGSRSTTYIDSTNTNAIATFPMPIVPAQVSISRTTRPLFTAAGSCILWDKSQVHLIDWDTHAVQNSRDLSFGAEEIVDISTFEDELFILSGIRIGIQWARYIFSEQPFGYYSDISVQTVASQGGRLPLL